MSENRASIAQVLNFVNSFHEQCRNMVWDAVRLLRDNHQLYLTHAYSWDYAKKPNDHFLTQDYSVVRRTWATFVPGDDKQYGCIFLFDFFHPRSRVVPTLIFGSLDPGNVGFDNADRWATFNTIDAAEKSEATATVRHEGPVAVVTSKMPKRFEESAIVRVPLEAIVDQTTLEGLVVAPLAHLLNGERATAVRLLENVPTELWPATQTGPTDDEEDDAEQA